MQRTKLTLTLAAAVCPFVWSAALGTSAALAERGISVAQPSAQVFDVSLSSAPSGAATAAWVAYPYGADPEVRLVQVSPSGEAGQVTSLAALAGDVDPRSVDVAVGGDGDSTLVWSGNGQVISAQVQSSGEIGPARVIGNGEEPRIEIDRSGTPTVVSITRQGIVAIRLDSHGVARRSSRLLKADAVDSFEFALDRRGRATLAATTGFSNARIQIVRTAGGLRRPKRVAKRNAGKFAGGKTPELSLGTNARGSSTVAWSELRHGSRRVVAIRVSSKGRASKSRVLSNGGDRFLAEPDVLVAPDGSATVAWSSRPGAKAAYRTNRIVIATVNKHGKPSRARSISPREDAREPVVAPYRNHGVRVAWRAAGHKGHPGSTCIAERRLSGRRRHKIRRIADSCPAGSGPEVAIDRGGLILAWTGEGIRIRRLR